MKVLEGRQRRRRRAATTVLVAVAAIGLGALSTVGIAWIGPTATTIRPQWFTFSNEPDRFWADDERGGHYRVVHTLGFDLVDFSRIIFVGQVEDQLFYLQNPPPDWAAVLSIDLREGYDDVLTLASGWPWRALALEQWSRWSPPPVTGVLPVPFLDSALPAATAPTGSNGPYAYAMRHCLAVTIGGHSVSLPLRPIWSGLVSDTVLFAAIWFGAFAAVPFVRRRVRGWRGRCPVCGYSRTGRTDDARCPECGG
ncbi:MAG: hypothetical protein KDA22_09235 [Phycisphaerales bacterium]|nr:hypothetical protein [Phycisphaerales bacterium]